LIKITNSVYKEKENNIRIIEIISPKRVWKLKKKAGTPGLESPSEPVYVFIKQRI